MGLWYNERLFAGRVRFKVTPATGNQIASEIATSPDDFPQKKILDFCLIVRAV